MQSKIDRNRNWWTLARQGSVIRRALIYAVIVGPVLIAINHGDTILRGQVDFVSLLKMGLTFFVPYVVSTCSSVAALLGPAASQGNPNAGRK